VSADKEALDALNRRNQALSDQVKALKKQIADDGDATPDSGESADPQVRNQSVATKLISQGGFLDLLASDDPTWQFSTDESSGDGEGELSYDSENGGIYTAGFSLAHLDKGPATYSACSRQTAWAEADSYVDPSALERDNVCLRISDNGMIGTLRVTEATPTEVVMNIKTWELS